VDLGDGWVQGEHFRGVAVDQGVDFQVRGVVLEDAEHRRGEQHVAVVAQLDDQYAAQGG